MHGKCFGRVYCFSSLADSSCGSTIVIPRLLDQTLTRITQVAFMVDANPGALRKRRLIHEARGGNTNSSSEAQCRTAEHTAHTDNIKVNNLNIATDGCAATDIRDALQKSHGILEEILDCLRHSELLSRGHNDIQSRFWTVYQDVANKADDGFLEKHNGDLDVHLIFAGLLSAISSTFIVQLETNPNPGPMDKTNALLAQLLLTLDNQTANNQPPLSQSSQSVTFVSWIQFFGYASLSLSLFASFFIVLCKQRLSHFKTSQFGQGTPEERCMQRQENFIQIQKWYFPLLLETVPFLLQISLLLFAVFIIGILFSQNRLPAWVVIGLVSLALVIHSCTWIVPFADNISFRWPRFIDFRPIIDYFTRTRLQQKPYPEDFTAQVKDSMLELSLVEKDGFQAVKYLFETSTHPYTISIAAEMLQNVVIPPGDEVKGIVSQLRYNYQACSDGDRGSNREDLPDQALACYSALLYIFHFQEYYSLCFGLDGGWFERRFNELDAVDNSEYWNLELYPKHPISSIVVHGNLSVTNSLTYGLCLYLGKNINDEEESNDAISYSIYVWNKLLDRRSLSDRMIADILLGIRIILGGTLDETSLLKHNKSLSLTFKECLTCLREISGSFAMFCRVYPVFIRLLLLPHFIQGRDSTQRGHLKGFLCPEVASRIFGASQEATMPKFLLNRIEGNNLRLSTNSEPNYSNVWHFFFAFKSPVKFMAEAQENLIQRLNKLIPSPEDVTVKTVLIKELLLLGTVDWDITETSITTRRDIMNILRGVLELSTCSYYLLITSLQASGNLLLNGDCRHILESDEKSKLVSCLLELPSRSCMKLPSIDSAIIETRKYYMKVLRALVGQTTLQSKHILQSRQCLQSIAGWAFNGLRHHYPVLEFLDTLVQFQWLSPSRRNVVTEETYLSEAIDRVRLFVSAWLERIFYTINVPLDDLSKTSLDISGADGETDMDAASFIQINGHLLPDLIQVLLVDSHVFLEVFQKLHQELEGYMTDSLESFPNATLASQSYNKMDVLEELLLKVDAMEDCTLKQVRRDFIDKCIYILTQTRQLNGRTHSGSSSTTQGIVLFVKENLPMKVGLYKQCTN